MIVVIPARGGSKRVKGKNLRPLAGVPLVKRAVNIAIESGFASAVYVSTESQEIAKIAEAAGARIILRPMEFAKDTASTESVVLHVLEILANEGLTPEWVMTLPPTSPFRKISSILEMISLINREPEAQDCLMSVTEERGDFWRMNNTESSITRLFPDAPRRQQDRNPLYEENSAIYLTKSAALQETGSILGNRVRGFPIDPLEAFDINTELDFKIAEAMISAYPELAEI